MVRLSETINNKLSIRYWRFDYLAAVDEKLILSVLAHFICANVFDFCQVFDLYFCIQMRHKEVYTG